MKQMNEQIIAVDFLITAKTSVLLTAKTLTESATSEVRDVLRKHLDDAVAFHERVLNYAVSHGVYYPHNICEQVKKDIRNAQTISVLADQPDWTASYMGS